ncbi:MAG: AAA family ATPase [Flavobacteriales bacterium]|nr:AAA family ATPase [Flavobacteriales bacterium]
MPRVRKRPLSASTAIPVTVTDTHVVGLRDQLLQALGHTPTAGQERAIAGLERLMDTPRERAALVLKGYAGTGKTTLVGALVKVLSSRRKRVVLLAPTGRAAKVLAAYAGQAASTIHRRIYRVGEDDGGSMQVVANKDGGALFIVDEASMIGRSSMSDGPFGARDLLNDLFEHVYSAPGSKLLLIGDPAQLPPVGSDKSPALDVKELASFGLVVGSMELTEVVRQAAASGILTNATALREVLDREKPMPRFVSGFTDVLRLDGHELQDALETAYGQEGDDEVCLICRSNKRAYQYSQQVRMRIHGYDEELCSGDRLMVVKNNYFWAGRNGKAELIANGEQLVVKRTHGTEELHGLRFADITAGWWTGTEERELEVKVMLDVLSIDAPALPGPRSKLFRQALFNSYTARTKAHRSRMLREDPYAQALQVKYAYAVTAHKAQGGQWSTVFVDQGYITDEMIDHEYVRWLYTAVTRASERLYLVNFHPRFWGEEA